MKALRQGAASHSSSIARTGTGQVPLEETSRVLEAMSNYETIGYSVIVAD